MQFEFATATRIIFGPGTLRLVGSPAKELGRHVMVVTGRDARRADRLISLLGEQGIITTTFSVQGEPEVNRVEMAAVMARRQHCDFVIGFGGGSALDAGKAIAAMLSPAARVPTWAV